MTWELDSASYKMLPQRHTVNSKKVLFIGLYASRLGLERWTWSPDKWCIRWPKPENERNRLINNFVVYLRKASVITYLTQQALTAIVLMVLIGRNIVLIGRTLSVIVFTQHSANQYKHFCSTVAALYETKQSFFIVDLHFQQLGYSSNLVWIKISFWSGYSYFLPENVLSKWSCSHFHDF